jgi:hypothetical protein
MRKATLTLAIALLRRIGGLDGRRANLARG